MGTFGTGQAIRRKEDERFTLGLGRYTDDVATEHAAHLYLFRSPYAHGTITELDVSAAREAPGIVAVYTGDDLIAAGVRDLPAGALPPSSKTTARAGIGQPPLARERVRYVGEPVVAIVAESIAAAKDAAELVLFDVDELDAVVRPRDALADGAPQIHDDVPGNRIAILEHGDADATDQAFARARIVVDLDIVNNRLAPTAMEPRGCVVSFDSASGKMTLYQGCQGVHGLKDNLLKSIRVEDLHVISPDVGGGFGLKMFLQCETVVAAHAARDTGRTVKWIADRSESFLSDLHGRDHQTRASLALNEDGRVLGLRVDIDATTGAYCGQVGPIIPWFGAMMSSGCYAIPAGYVAVHMAMTNTVPVDAYRGAGRPEAAYLIERLMDKAANATGLTRDEIRRRNFIRPDQFPYRTFTGTVYDSGEYTRLMDAALERAEWPRFESRRAESARRGKLRGIGLAYYVEICSGLGSEETHIKFEKDGRVSVLIGTQSTGQGHETSYSQMIADGLGVDIDKVDIIQGDSEKVPTGWGTAGSRSMVIGGSALYRTVDSMIEAGRRQASELLEAAAADIEFDGGEFRIAGTDRRVTISEVAAASYENPAEGVAEGLRCNEEFTPEAGTFPNGCHICEIEIDPETGVYEFLRYTVEDDVGTVVNPLILEGQIMGGVAQGLGQACGEHAVYDTDSGQFMTATFMDYAMPRADWVPDIDFRYQEVPSPRNPLGIKGAGEAGTVGAAPAFVSAVLDALGPEGVGHIDMPVTPMKIWQALND
jgi:carbon-monoxide dehydrogenase large subunit